MTITGQVLVSIVAIVFSAGVAYGVVKATIQKQSREIAELKKAVDELGNCAQVVRKYLFNDDGTTMYVPAVTCYRSHEKQDKRFDQFEEKLDRILESVK